MSADDVRWDDPRSGDVRWETHPVTPERFEDFADVINPNRRDNHCWCLSHRCTQAEISAAGATRADAMRTLTEREPPGCPHLSRRRAGRLVQHRPAGRHTRLAASLTMAFV